MKGKDDRSKAEQSSTAATSRRNFLKGGATVAGAGLAVAAMPGLAAAASGSGGNMAAAANSRRSPSTLMEDVRQAVLEADLQLGKKPHISAPIHVSSTAQIVTTGRLMDTTVQIQESSTSIAIDEETERLGTQPGHSLARAIRHDHFEVDDPHVEDLPENTGQFVLGEAGKAVQKEQDQ